MVSEEGVELEPDTFGEDSLPPIELPHTERSIRDGPFGRRSYRQKKPQPTFSHSSLSRNTRTTNENDHQELQMEKNFNREVSNTNDNHNTNVQNNDYPY